MSRFLRFTPFETTFDGEKVTARLKPLLTVDQFRINESRVVAKVGATTAESEKAAADSINAAMRIFAEILPHYVESFKGVITADGSAIDIDEVVNQSYFSMLVLEMGLALVATGQLKPEKPLNLVKSDAAEATGTSG